MSQRCRIAIVCIIEQFTARRNRHLRLSGRDTTANPPIGLFLCAAGEMPSANQATLAQSVERLTRNEQVVSSILTSGSDALGWLVCNGCPA